MASAPPEVKMMDAGGAQFPSSAEGGELHLQRDRRTKEDNFFCSTPFDVCFVCNACFVVPERTNIVQLFFGRYHGTITKPGCYCRTNIAMEFRRVSMNLFTFDLENTKVLDARGSPIVISGIITYSVADARAAAIDVSDPHDFVRDQAPAVLKRVVAMYPYESSEVGIPSLRSETVEIATRMRDALQARCAVAGVHIESFSVNELSYAPEIASTMLRRQQAEALIEARRKIVEGAKEIAKEVLQDVGQEMNREERASMLSNLLVVLVGDKDVTPTLQI